jgi:hypothetical protein
MAPYHRTPAQRVSRKVHGEVQLKRLDPGIYQPGYNLTARVPLVVTSRRAPEGATLSEYQQVNSKNKVKATF